MKKIRVINIKTGKEVGVDYITYKEADGQEFESARWVDGVTLDFKFFICGNSWHLIDHTLYEIRIEED